MILKQKVTPTDGGPTHAIFYDTENLSQPKLHTLNCDCYDDQEVVEITPLIIDTDYLIGLTLLQMAQGHLEGVIDVISQADRELEAEQSAKEERLNSILKTLSELENVHIQSPPWLN